MIIVVLTYLLFGSMAHELVIDLAFCAIAHYIRYSSIFSPNLLAPKYGYMV